MDASGIVWPTENLARRFGAFWEFSGYRPTSRNRLPAILSLGQPTDNWLVVGPPLWKIWVRQLGWLATQYFWENSKNGNQTTNQITFLQWRLTPSLWFADVHWLPLPSQTSQAPSGHQPSFINLTVNKDHAWYYPARSEESPLHTCSYSTAPQKSWFVNYCCKKHTSGTIEWGYLTWTGWA